MTKKKNTITQIFFFKIMSRKKKSRLKKKEWEQKKHLTRVLKPKTQKKTAYCTWAFLSFIHQISLTKFSSHFGKKTCLWAPPSFLFPPLNQILSKIFSLYLFIFILPKIHYTKLYETHPKGLCLEIWSFLRLAKCLHVN